MSFPFLQFLTSPWFVVLWFVTGTILAVYTLYDEYVINTNVNKALKWGWPILITFLSPIAFILYLYTCRPPGIQNKTGETEKHLHHEYVSPMFKKVTGSVIHCVAGDGLGIMSAMVVSRIFNFPFWTEFWFEYAVGFLFGWLIFQYAAMRNMGNNKKTALYKAFRAEFFSMITVMLGMGLVMRFVTPAVVGHPPDPNTAAFWGFSSLGLLVGMIFTYPMNWWLVKKGWKHGMS